MVRGGGGGLLGQVVVTAGEGDAVGVGDHDEGEGRGDLWGVLAGLKVVGMKKGDVRCSRRGSARGRKTS